ncbi:MAG: LytTR family transcriptional regulator [Donghicola eburneus]|nr:LytTR family DNA-binding domain-containing protein [Donghicola eburneus]MCI5042580.1 LytTR family transcriptional regulator [Donghicola eburneus]
MSKFSQALDTPFALIDILSGRYRVKLRTALPAIFSLTSFLFFVVLVLTLWISDPLDYHDYIAPSGALLMWSTGTVIIVCSYVGGLILWASTPLSQKLPIPITLAGLPAFALSTLYHRILGEIFSGGEWTQELWPSHVFLFVTQIGFEVLYLRYGLPKSFQDIADRKDAAAQEAAKAAEPVVTDHTPSSSKHITLPGEAAIVLEDVWLVRALEHYVEIHTEESAQRVVRARIADFIAQVGHDHGIQTHRSWWVSARAAKQLISENGKRFLELHDGQKIPVSRGRLADVQEWLSEKIGL